METIKIEITEEQIRAGIEKSFSEALKNTYGNPVKDAVEASIKSNEGAIKKIVDEVIVAAITNPEFKTKISDIVIQRMVESAF